MRWEQLFADLEAQALEAERAELSAEVEERVRQEVGRLELADRLAAHHGSPVRLWVPGVGVVAGAIASSGRDWVVLSEECGRSALVPLAAVAALEGLTVAARAPQTRGRVEEKLDLRYALRALTRDRSEVVATCTDGTQYAGTLARVGGDFVDLTSREARALVVLPLRTLAAVRSA